MQGIQSSQTLHSDLILISNYIFMMVLIFGLWHIHICTDSVLVLTKLLFLTDNGIFIYEWYSTKKMVPSPY